MRLSPIKSTIFAAAVLLFASSCSSKKYVRAQIDPINQRVGALESRTQDTDASLEKLSQAASRADERAAGADARAGKAMEEAKSAQSDAAKANDAAQTAQRAAGDARMLAEKGNAAAADAQRRIESMDDYQLAVETAILFASNRSQLTAEGTKALDEIAAKAIEHRRYVIELQGFTDRTGSASANLELSRQRAASVARYLNLTHGIPLYRIHSLGFGSEKPAVDASTRNARRQNRRVEVRVFTAGTAEGNKLASR